MDDGQTQKPATSNTFTDITASNSAAQSADATGSSAAATTESTNTPVEIPEHLQDAFPEGTTVEQTSDGQLKAIVPGDSTKTESSVHHFFVELEHGIEALAEKVQDFFTGGDAADQSDR